MAPVLDGLVEVAPPEISADIIAIRDDLVRLQETISRGGPDAERGNVEAQPGARDLGGPGAEQRFDEFNRTECAT